MQNNYFKSGDWNILCDVCGWKIKASESKHRWDGLIVCKSDWEPRHELDFIKARTEQNSIPFSRPEPAVDNEILTTCDFWSNSPMADFGTADCMTVGGNTSIPFLIELYGATSIAARAIAGRSISGVL